MKNVMFVLSFCLFAGAAAAQQTTSFGPVAGLNFAKISNSGAVDTEFKTGAVLGAQVTHSNINKWGVGGAILYSREGVTAIANGNEVETSLTYLRVPLKGYIFFRDNEDGFRPKIFLGPSFGFMLDAETEAGGEEVNVKNNFHTFDLGLTGGLGFNARISDATWFNFDAGYTHGLLDISKFGDGSNRVFTVTAGVAFGF